MDWNPFPIQLLFIILYLEFGIVAFVVQSLTPGWICGFLKVPQHNSAIIVSLWEFIIKNMQG